MGRSNPKGQIIADPATYLTPTNQANVYDYGYDVNGNMVTDRNKGINGNVGMDQATGGAIVYNHLNLP